MIGSLAATHGSTGRWWFYRGSVTASVLWLCALGYGARLFTPLVRSNARTGQVIDSIVAVTMFGFAVIRMTT